MVPALKHISNRKKSIKQLSHFSSFWPLIEQLLNLKQNETNAAIETIYF